MEARQILSHDCAEGKLGVIAQHVVGAAGIEDLGAGEHSPARTGQVIAPGFEFLAKAGCQPLRIEIAPVSFGGLGQLGGYGYAPFPRGQ